MSETISLVLTQQLMLGMEANAVDLRPFQRGDILNLPIGAATAMALARVVSNDSGPALDRSLGTATRFVARGMGSVVLDPSSGVEFIITPTDQNKPSQGLRKPVQPGMKREHRSVGVPRYDGERSGDFRPECAVSHSPYSRTILTLGSIIGNIPMQSLDLNEPQQITTGSEGMALLDKLNGIIAQLAPGADSSDTTPEMATHIFTARHELPVDLKRVAFELVSPYELAPDLLKAITQQPASESQLFLASITTASEVVLLR